MLHQKLGVPPPAHNSAQHIASTAMVVVTSSEKYYVPVVESRVNLRWM